MEDDISIPSLAYGGSRRSRSMDPGTRRLALIATGIAGALVVVAEGWHMVAHRHHEVPVVRAEPGPVRLKPASPGGLQIAGIDHNVFSGGSDSDVQKLAPLPQTPDPQALQAMASPQPAVPPVAAAPPTTMPPAPVTRTHEAPPEPTAAAPAAGPAAIAARPQGPTERAGEAERRAAGRRPALVQLAALSSEQAAREEWARLVRRWPDLLGGRHPEFSKVVHDGHILWRVRTGGFAGFSEATLFCERLRAKRASCSVADF